VAPRVLAFGLPALLLPAAVALERCRGAFSASVPAPFVGFSLADAFVRFEADSVFFCLATVGARLRFGAGSASSSSSSSAGSAHGSNLAKTIPMVVQPICSCCATLSRVIAQAPVGTSFACGGPAASHRLPLPVALMRSASAASYQRPSWPSARVLHLAVPVLLPLAERSPASAVLARRLSSALARIEHGRNSTLIY